ncbi:DUF2474 family protein [Microbulbifer sp. SAOS-129_SWC]
MKDAPVFCKQLAWMVVIWALSVASLGVVAGLLRWWLLG